MKRLLPILLLCAFANANAQNTKVTIKSSNPQVYGGNGSGSGTVTFVGLSMPPAFHVSNTPISTTGTLSVTMNGTTSQYIDGLGNYRIFPTIPTTTSQLTNNSGFLTQNQAIILSGDATGTGSNNIVVSLPATGIVSGQYTNPTITFDSKGRAIAAASGSPGSNNFTSGIAAADGLITLTRSGMPNISTVANGHWNIDAQTVTNGVYSNILYTDPAWLLKLSASKLTGQIPPSVIAAGTPSEGYSPKIVNGVNTWSPATSATAAAQSLTFPIVGYQATGLTAAGGSGSGSTVHILAPTSYVPSTRYFVDGGSGSDANAGDSLHPWFSLDKVNALALTANIGVYFKRGYSYAPTSSTANKGLYLFQKSGSASQPIVIGAYGTGAAPKINYCSAPTNTSDNRNVIYLYQSSNVVIDGLAVSNPAYSLTDNVRSGQASWGYGINIDNGGDSTRATGVVIRNCDISLVGVAIAFTAFSGTIQNNNLHHLRMVVDNNSSGDYGANGIVLAGSNNIIKDNNIYECWAKDSFFGYDGGAVEIFSAPLGCSRNQILRNYTYNNQGFAEVGGNATTDVLKDNLIAYNTIINSGKVLLFQGGTTFGATTSNMQFYNNTVLINTIQAYNTNTNWFLGISYSGSNAGTLASTSLLVCKNNVFYIDVTWYLTKSSSAFTASQLPHTNNVIRLGANGVYGPGWTASASDNAVAATTALFNNTTNSDASLWDYSPVSGSPLIDYGTAVGQTIDLYGNSIVSNPDAGALEKTTGTSIDVLLDGSDFTWSSQYVGAGKSVYLEIVGSNGASATLYTSGGAAVSGSTVTASGTTSGIAQSAALTLYDGVTYKLGWKAATSSTATLRQARLIIQNTVAY